MADIDRGHLTVLLRKWTAGDAAAGEDVLEAVYDHIHAIAARRLKSSQAALQPTELVNELVANLLEAGVSWNDRQHFFRAVAVAMRNILLDLARRSASLKNGGGQLQVTLGAAEGEPANSSADAELLHDALATLRLRNARKADVLELTYLVGLDHAEVAEVLGISIATMNRDLRFGHAWLKKHLG